MPSAFVPLLTARTVQQKILRYIQRTPQGQGHDEDLALNPGIGLALPKNMQSSELRDLIAQHTVTGTALNNEVNQHLRSMSLALDQQRASLPIVFPASN